jgi:hypothetical protein
VLRAGRGATGTRHRDRQHPPPAGIDQELLGGRVEIAVRNRHPDVVRASEAGEARGAGGVVGRCERREGTLADDHWVHELDRRMGGVGRRGAGAEGNQGAAARERAGHRMAGASEVGALALEQLPDDSLALRDLLGQSSRGADGQALRHRSTHSIPLALSSDSSCS